MTARDEPLDLPTWFDRARKLCETLGGLEAAPCPDVILRQAFYLSKLLPDPLWDLFSAPAGEAEFEELLASGDATFAAGAFLNAELDYLARRTAAPTAPASNAASSIAGCRSRRPPSRRPLSGPG